MADVQTQDARRPVAVTLVAALVVLVGVLVVVVGIALVVFRDNDIEQIPALLARLDEALPFDSGQDLGAYMAVVGAIVAVVGLVIALLGWGVARGSRASYVVALVLLAAFAGGAAYLAAGIDDDLARGGLQVLAAGFGVTALLLALLLVGRRTRAWATGRAAA